MTAGPSQAEEVLRRQRLNCGGRSQLDQRLIASENTIKLLGI